MAYNYDNVCLLSILLFGLNVEVTGAARLYRAASVWTAGLGDFYATNAPLAIYALSFLATKQAIDAIDDK
jgi:hypothetical protein